MKKILTLFFALIMVHEGFSQTIVGGYNWNFATSTTTTFPAGFVTWNLDGQTASTNLSATFNNAGWVLFAASANGAGVAATTSYFTNTAVACDRWLVTPDMNIPNGIPNVCLEWNASSGDGNFPDTYEVKISTTDSATGSFTTTALTITENASATTHILPLASYAGQRIRVAFRDISTNEYILLFNSIKLVNLPSNAAHIADVEIYEHNYINQPVAVNGINSNTGFDTINTFDMNYSVNGAAPITYSATGAGLIPQQFYTYSHPTAFNPTTAGTYNIKVWFSNLNGSGVSSDTAQTTLFFYPQAAGLKKEVLLEEFTGAWCGYCTGGALTLRDLIAAKPYAHTVALHDMNGGTVANDAMQNADGHTINNTYNTGFPSTMVDRLYFFDNKTTTLGFYAYNGPNPSSIQDTAAAFRYLQATPVNVSLSNKTYDSTTGVLSVSVNATFLNSLSQGDYRLNLYVVEDSIIKTGAGYDQHNYYSSAGNNYDAGMSPLNAFPAIITNSGLPNAWTQNHVLRAMVGGAWGTSGMIPSAPVAGTTYSNVYTTTINSAWRNKFISIIGVVQEYNTNTNLRTILNVVEAPLLGYATGIAETAQFNKLSLYPNPASTMAVIDMDLKQNATVNVSVVNALGQTVVNAEDNLLNAGEHTLKVPVSNLADGLYFVKVIVNGQTSSLPLSISK